MSTAIDVRRMVEDYIVDNILFGDGDRLQADGPLQESRILDSLGLLGVITFIEQRFGIVIADDEVIPENFDTLNRISEFVARKMNGGTTAQQAIRDLASDFEPSFVRNPCAASLAPVVSNPDTVRI